MFDEPFRTRRDAMATRWSPGWAGCGSSVRHPDARVVFDLEPDDVGRGGGISWG
jgi:hypothetical protein